MKTSLDIFGEALLEYSRGNRKKFFFQMVSGEEYEHSLKRYFRTYRQLTKSERKLISLASGKILDVGCATGYYLPTLMKKGQTIGIEISPHAVQVAHERNIRNCLLADIFHFKTNIKFDTITLLENNIGMGGTPARTKILLNILSKLLKPNGQILALSKKVNNARYRTTKLHPMWNGKTGTTLKWINLEINFLSDLCSKVGMKLTKIESNRYNHLLKIVKNNSY